MSDFEPPDDDRLDLSIKIYLATCFVAAMFGVVVFFALVGYAWRLIGT